ncbi:uncharacterized protein LOC124358634 isoform X1 [Homalodisca vitripennis]|uniref:uncharacterized protein LOC124358634 isoform X1 n=1 Tax=Homalodisca vitripennis TaxID=197043 RepID=UPI001EEB66BF|nr:uncharacterized protein LOC124358634 isoform X1 [Homalodisca vitripennis]
MVEPIINQDIFIQYRYNLYNKYLGSRVRVNVRNRKKRTKTFIGKLQGYDLHLNVVLADVYRVILYNTEEQRQDVDGLMVIRGVNVQSIRLACPEPHLLPWPTKPTKLTKAASKSPARSKEEPPKPPTPARPLKLKRAWLTSPSPSGDFTPSRQRKETSETPSTDKAANEGEKGEEKRIPEEVKKETPKSENITSPTDADEKASVLQRNAEEEVIIKREPEDDSLTFEEFILANNDIGEDYVVKSEVQDSDEGDMPENS